MFSEVPVGLGPNNCEYVGKTAGWMVLTGTQESSGNSSSSSTVHETGAKPTKMDGQDTMYICSCISRRWGACCERRQGRADSTLASGGWQGSRGANECGERHSRHRRVMRWKVGREWDMERLGEGVGCGEPLLQSASDRVESTPQLGVRSRRLPRRDERCNRIR